MSDTFEKGKADQACACLRFPLQLRRLRMRTWRSLRRASPEHSASHGLNYPIELSKDIDASGLR